LLYTFYYECCNLESFAFAAGSSLGNDGSHSKCRPSLFEKAMYKYISPPSFIVGKADRTEAVFPLAVGDDS
jgi:hypothetical protein